MLVLSRRVNEKVVLTIGDEKVVVCVVSIESQKVKLGFEANRNVTVDREEIHVQKAKVSQSNGSDAMGKK